MLQTVLFLLLSLCFAVCAAFCFMAALVAGGGFPFLIVGIVFTVIACLVIKKAQKRNQEAINKKNKTSVKKNEVKMNISHSPKNDEIKTDPELEHEKRHVPITENVICIDTETTGLNETDEILQLSIVDIKGEVLFSEYIRPKVRKRWPKAQEIHGISYAMVKDKPTLLDYQQQIEQIINGADLVVGYNVNYDLRMLHYGGIKMNLQTPTYDVMKEFAPVYGEQNSYNGSYKWQKLTTCAEYYGYKLNAHDALEDAKATIHCYKCIEGIN